MNIKSKKISVSLSYVSTIINYIGMFLVTPIIIKVLGKNEFGLYSLVHSIIGYLALLSLGLGSAYVRFYFRVRSQKNDYTVDNLNGMYFLSYVVMAVAVVIAGIGLIIFSEHVFGPKLTIQEHQTAKILLAILTFNLASTFVFSIFWSYIRAVEHFVIIEIAMLIKIILSPTVTIAFLFLGFGSVGFVTATTIVTTLIEIFVAIYAIKKGGIKFKFNIFDKGLFKEIIGYSLYIFGFQLLNQLNNGIDNLVLGWTGGTEIVSIYAVGVTISGVILSLPNGITSVIIPEINRIATNEEDKINIISELQIRYGRMIFMIIAFVLSGFIMIGLPFLNLWVGTGFEDAYWIVILLAIPKLFGYSLAVSSEYIKAENRHKTRLISFAIAIVLNISISIPLAIKFGPIGAAIGTGFTYLLYITFMHFYYVHKFKLRIYSFWKEVGIISIIYSLILAPFIILSHFIDIYNLWIMLAVGAGYVVVFAITNYVFLLNKYEKALVKSFLKKKKKAKVM